MSTYLVAQATGHQALCTIDNLLAAGAKVHALVRDPGKIPAALQRPGIRVFGRDNNNPEALYKAAQGCKGVYLNTHPSPLELGTEAQQATSVLEACKAAGVESVVACTTFLANQPSTWADATSKEFLGAYYGSKVSIEEVVRGAGLKSYTILRPAFIHHDYVLPWVLGNYPDLHKSGTLAHAFSEKGKMLHIDEQDIGKYAAAALLDQEKFGGQEIQLANENLSVEEVRDLMVKVTGRDIKVKKWTPEETEAALASIFLTRFMLWPANESFSSDAKAVEEKFGIPFTSLEEYFQREKDKLLECLPTEA
jgi:uncharacterized protein YbjT (DUF2867 family)